jgi:DNA invertase Pin-like site-specific DNA recombinase
MKDHDNEVAGPTPGRLGQDTTTARQDRRGSRSTKIGDRHLDRLAIVYVRQSTPQQVLEHKQSRERQYALADTAVALGWAKERVQIIDEDQGQSGKTALSRLGFQRILAEVTMDHVGLVLGLEMSRLSRSSKDWHHLLEVCALFGTLLADQDGVYDPHDSNDRLLLGLKGTMSEFELCTMRNRLERGKLHKAARGKLFLKVPCGYVKLPSGEVALDPDEQARTVAQLVFDKFDELGTVYGVFHYLVRSDIRMGMRAQDGPRRGQLEWRRPSLATLNQMLHNPIYAGAYAYGRRPCDPRRKALGTSKTEQRRVPMSEWKVLLPNCLPAYITWERYLANQERMHQNRSLPDTAGTPRDGAALLTRLLVCGTCGRFLHACYPSRSNIHYKCETHLQRGDDKVCYGLKASVIDELVTNQVLRALEPAALELSLTAIADIERGREQLHHHWRQRLERARYESERAERQYQAVEPENRLVARTLERRWEEAMQEQKQLTDEYDRFLREQPSSLSEDEKNRIRTLSRDIPALWNAAGTTAADRKEIIRILVESVVVRVRNDCEQVGATIHWRGGSASHHTIVRPVARYEHLRDYDRLKDHLVGWRREGYSAVKIAAKLNAAGFRPPRKQGTYTTEQVQRLLFRCGLTHDQARVGELGPNESWLPDLARELGLPATKLRDWAVRGWVNARKTPAQRPWIIWADAFERKRLTRLKIHSKRGIVALPDELITPKSIPKNQRAFPR